MDVTGRATEVNIATYQASARQRWTARLQEQADRRQRAQKIAMQAATMLREQFGARRVVLFGSLARGDLFHVHSDVDIAAWGLDDRELYRATSRVLDLDPTIGVDLVMVEQAPASLQEVIKREGIPL